MHPKDETPLHLKQNSLQMVFPEEICSQSHIGESSRCLENRLKETMAVMLPVQFISTVNPTTTHVPTCPT